MLAIVIHPEVPLIWGVSSNSHFGTYCHHPHFVGMEIESEKEKVATLVTAAGFEACLP